VKISGASASPRDSSSEQPTQASSSTASSLATAVLAAAPTTAPVFPQGIETNTTMTSKTPDEECDLGAFLMDTFVSEEEAPENPEGWVVLPPFPSDEEMGGELTAY